jgi:hypothetical protein
MTTTAGVLQSPDPDAVEPVTLPAALVDELGTIAGIEEPELRTLWAQEASLTLGVYRRRRAQAGSELNRKGRRDLLGALEASLQQVTDRLGAMDSSLERTLALLWPVPRSSGRSGDKRQGLSVGIESIRQLLEAVARTNRVDRSRKGARGPEPNVDLYLLVRDLCDLYEQWTGRRVAYRPNKGPLYAGPPQNESGRFVLELVRVVEPRVPPTRVSGLIRERNRNREAERPNWRGP